MKASDWITIAAILLGPIFAVVTQFVWQKVREAREQKLRIFSALAGLRGGSITAEYVRALNLIDVVFYSNTNVRNKWKVLLTHLSSDLYRAQPIAAGTLERTRDLIAEMLVEMAKDLGFGYDFTHMKEGAYYPQLLVTADNDTFNLRQKLLAALDSKGMLSVKVVEDIPQPAMAVPAGSIRTAASAPQAK